MTSSFARGHFVFVGFVILVACFCVPTAWASAYESLILSDNPVAYYRFEEPIISNNQTMVDQTTNNLDGTYTTSVTGGVITASTNVPGPGSTQSLSVDGGPRGAVNDNNLLDITGDLTLEAWINPAAGVIASGDNSGILSKYSGAGGNRSYQLSITNDRELQMIVTGNGQFSNAALFTSSVLIPLDEWSYVVGVYDADPTTPTMSLYINGVEDTSATLSGASIPTAIFSGTAPLLIGYQFDVTSSSPTRAFDGLIDEAAVYDRALSSAEILDHYNTIPEPASLLLTALGGLMLLRRPRMK